MILTFRTFLTSATFLATTRTWTLFASVLRKNERRDRQTCCKYCSAG